MKKEKGWHREKQWVDANVVTIGSMYCNYCHMKIKKEDDEGQYLFIRVYNINHRGNETERFEVYHKDCPKSSTLPPLPTQQPLPDLHLPTLRAVLDRSGEAATNIWDLRGWIIEQIEKIKANESNTTTG